MNLIDRLKQMEREVREKGVGPVVHLSENIETYHTLVMMAATHPAVWPTHPAVPSPLRTAPSTTPITAIYVKLGGRHRSVVWGARQVDGSQYLAVDLPTLQEMIHRIERADQ